MSTSAISSSLLSQVAGSSATSDQFVTDLNNLAQDLTSGNLSAAQQDFVTLSQDALDGATSSTATTSDSGITSSLLKDIASSSSSSSSFVSDLNQLGTDLQNGDQTSAQQDMLSLDSVALNAASAAGGGTSPTTASSTAPTNSGETATLIEAIVQAMGAGDSSVVSTGLSELASVSSNSEGASYLQAMSDSFGSSGSSSSNSVSQLVGSLNSSSSDSSSSILSLLA